MTNDSQTPPLSGSAAEVFHPSVFIQEELDARGWSLMRLAVEMGGDVAINRLALDLYMEVGRTDRNLRIGEFSAQQLGKAFGVSPDFFLNLEKQWLEGTMFMTTSLAADIVSKIREANRLLSCIEGWTEKAYRQWPLETRNHIQDEVQSLRALIARMEHAPETPTALVANWMIENGYITGHGDTVADLLSELVEQARMEQNTGMDIAMQKELVITLSDISPEGIRIMEPAKYPSIHIIPTAPTTKDDGLLPRCPLCKEEAFCGSEGWVNCLSPYCKLHAIDFHIHEWSALAQPAAPQPDLWKLIARMEEAAFNPTGDDRLGKFVPLDRCIALVKELV